MSAPAVKAAGHVMRDVRRRPGALREVAAMRPGVVVVDGGGDAAADVVDDACAALRPEQAAVEAGVLGEAGEERLQ